MLCLAIAPPSLQLCQPYPGLRRLTVIKVAEYEKNRFPRALDEIKFSINLPTVLSKVSFYSLHHTINYNFALTWQKYWTKEMQHYCDD